MSAAHGATLAEAYGDALEALLREGKPAPPVTDPLSPASSFGEAPRPALELLAARVSVGDATSALVVRAPWQANLAYAMALLLWTVSGSDDVDWLAYYRPDARRFTDDVAHSSGAFGRRLRGGGVDQLRAAVHRLRADPGTRRAAGVIFAPEDSLGTSREVPCCLAVQYFLRDGRLHAVTMMRAQHALKVLQYDALVFMGLQCLLAAELGVPPGDYHHLAGTFHIFEDERELADRTVKSSPRAVTIAPVPLGLNAYLEAVAGYERDLREAATAGDEVRTSALVAEVLAVPGAGLVQLSRLAWSRRACEVIGSGMKATEHRVTNALEAAHGP